MSGFQRRAEKGGGGGLEPVSIWVWVLRRGRKEIVRLRSVAGVVSLCLLCVVGMGVEQKQYMAVGMFRRLRAGWGGWLN